MLGDLLLIGDPVSNAAKVLYVVSLFCVWFLTHMGFAAYQLHELSRQERRYDNLHTHGRTHTHRPLFEALCLCWMSSYTAYIKALPKDFCRIVRERFELWKVVFERGEHQLQN